MTIKDLLNALAKKNVPEEFRGLEDSLDENDDGFAVALSISKLPAQCSEYVTKYGDFLREDVATPPDKFLAAGDMTGLMVRSAAMTMLKVAETGNLQESAELVGEELLPFLRNDRDSRQQLSRMFGLEFEYMSLTGVIFFAKAYGEFDVGMVCIELPMHIMMEEKCKVHVTPREKYKVCTTRMRGHIFDRKIMTEEYGKLLALSASKLTDHLMTHKVDMRRMKSITEDLRKFSERLVRDGHREGITGLLDIADGMKILEKTAKEAGVSGKDFDAVKNQVFSLTGLSEKIEFTSNLLACHMVINNPKYEAVYSLDEYLEIIKRVELLIYSSPKIEDVSGWSHVGGGE
jgi:hypothetical protein